ncbi:MAG: triose-phosphate isomerase [Vulcanimicrobiaceae bacterium]
MRRTIVAGNWKMYKDTHEAALFVDAFLDRLGGLPAGVEIVLCPPFSALFAVGQRVRRTRVRLGAQNMHWEDCGAYTGEISPPMLVDLGVAYVILGHSERRTLFGETDDGVRRKTAAALAHGLTPIVAVGETAAERDAGLTTARVVAQTQAALEGLPAGAVAKIVMAYEPIWAIGTGRNCDPEAANEVMRAIRGAVEGLAEAPILYGGSVKPENVAAYAACGEIDGALVGGASLDPNAFAALIASAYVQR